MNTIEGNRLIAEFMGLKAYPAKGTKEYKKRKGEACDFGYFQLKYDSSWDWLMPVVGKIEDIDEGRYAVSIQYRQCTIEDIEAYWSDSLIQYEAEEKESQISVVWETVVQFIQWRNKQK